MKLSSILIKTKPSVVHCLCRSLPSPVVFVSAVNAVLRTSASSTIIGFLVYLGDKAGALKSYRFSTGQGTQLSISSEYLH